MKPVAQLSSRVVVGALAAVFAFAAPRLARAQGNAQELIDKAVQDYENTLVDKALATFRQAISPSSPFEVSREQRVVAYKYIGAALAAQGQADSAIVYLRAALERDPFVDLDPAKFAPAELDAMARAKRLSFKAGIKMSPGGNVPLTGPVQLDPQTGSLAVTLLTTHIGKTRAEFVSLDSNLKYVYSAGDIDGTKDLRWNGFATNNKLLPAGSWVLHLVGQSSLDPSKQDSIDYAFDVRHDFPQLEDTLPTLTEKYLLPESYSGSASWKDLAKGVFVGAAAAGIGFGLQGSFKTPVSAFAMAAAGVGTGAVAFLLRSRDLSIPENIAENQSRRAKRDALVAAINDRNQQRLAQTKLTITPTSGVAR